MRLVAHRGFAAVEPENTVRAVRRAARVADAVEVDVRRCGSGEPVVIHDRSVDRVTEGTGRVADLNLATLQSLSVLGSGEPIPTLSAVRAAMPAKVELHVELKERGLAADALAMDDGDGPPLRVQSFDDAVVAEARDAEPSVPRKLSFVEEPQEGIERAVELGCEAIVVHHDHCDAAFVAAAHEVGLAVTAWTIETREQAAELDRAGVDAVISDDPDVLQGDQTGAL